MNYLNKASDLQRLTNNLPPKAIDHKGKTFGFLTVTEYAGKNKHGKSMWICLCKCGKTITTLANSLTLKKTVSCGICAKKFNAEKRKKPHRKTALYRKYWSMIDRCCHKTSKAWENYGGRGITVCDRWKESFDAFVDDMGIPVPRMTLERIDNNKGYSPDNCKWATMKEQQRNKRNTVFLTYGGKTKCLSEWAENLGVTSQAILYRIKNGYSTKEIFEKPFRNNQRACKKAL